MIKYKRKINMVPGGQPDAAIRMNQYDTDVVLELELYTSDGEFALDPNTELAIRGVKPDGNGVSVPGTIRTEIEKYTNIEKYIACIEVDPQMTAVAGDTKYKLVLINDGKELNTGSFVVEVDRAALDKDTLPSESVIREIVDTIDRTDEFLKASRSITKAKKEISDAVEGAKEAQKSAEAAREAAEKEKESAKVAVQAVLEGVEVIKKALEDLQNARDSALKDIETAGDAVRQKTLDEITSQIGLLGAINTEMEQTARTALEKATEAEKTVTEFINTQGNLRGRVDALEEATKG